jgi:hypothetical protein
MKRFWKIAGVATLVAILGVAALGAVSFAQEGEDWPFDFRGKFQERVAELLGVTVEEYDEAVQQAHEQIVDEALQEGWLTEEQAERMRERAEQGFGPGAFGPRGMGKGFMGPRGGFMERGGHSLLTVAAEQLGMEVTDLVAELQEGNSIAGLAGDKLDSIEQAYLDQLKENLTQAVTDEKITQNQADWMLEQAGEKLPDLLNNTWENCHPGGFPGGGRPGRMWGFPGQTDA